MENGAQCVTILGPWTMQQWYVDSWDMMEHGPHTTNQDLVQSGLKILSAVGKKLLCWTVGQLGQMGAACSAAMGEMWQWSVWHQLMV